jgi:hypothetical protein
MRSWPMPFASDPAGIVLIRPGLGKLRDLPAIQAVPGLDSV